MTVLSKQPVSRVVNAIAEEAGIDPLAPDPPLAEVVDSDVLETLITETAVSNLTVNFTSRGHDIVDADGRVQISRTEHSYPVLQAVF